MIESLRGRSDISNVLITGGIMNSKDFKGFPIQVIIDQVYKHKSVALPNYQREFVWKKKQLAALIDSCLRGYPISSAIYISYKKNADLYDPKTISGTDINRKSLEWLIIDGQQRITTLCRLLYLNKGDRNDPIELIDKKSNSYSFYFNLKACTKLKKGKLPPKNKNFAVSFRKRKVGHTETIEDLVKEGLFPTEWVFDTRKRKSYCENMHKEYIKTIKDVHERLTDFRVPVQFKDEHIKTAEQMAIFSRLNKMGTGLCKFDELVATLINKIKVNLHERWTSLSKKNDQFSIYDVDPLYIFKTMSIMKQQSEGVKISAPSANTIDNMCEKISKEQFDDYWRLATKYYLEALDFLKNKLGIIEGRYVPYAPAIVVLAASLWYIREKIFKGNIRNFKKKRTRWDEVLILWHWLAVLNGSFEQSTDNKIKEYFIILERKFMQMKKNEKVHMKFSEDLQKPEWSYIESRIKRMNNPGDALYKAILSLPLSVIKKDIQNDGVKPTETQDHHIVNQYWFKQGRPLEDKINAMHNICNRMITSSETNDSIGKALLSDDKLTKVSPRTLNLWLLPSSIQDEEYLSQDNIGEGFNDFIKDRRKLILSKLLSFKAITKNEQ